MALFGAAIAAANAACNTAPTTCTGNTKVDAVLKEAIAADDDCEIGLDADNTTYTWVGFCEALK